MGNSKILTEFKEGLKMEKLNIRLPKVVCDTIDKLVAENGEAKVDILLRGIVNELPSDVEAFLGSNVFKEMTMAIISFYENLYQNSEAVSFVAFVREHLLIDATAMTPEKRMKAAKLIFDIVYPDGGDTMTRNTFFRVILQKTYLEQIMNAAFESVKSNYTKAVSEMINSLKDFM